MRIFRYFFVTLHHNLQIIETKMKKILFINHEISPYVPETELSIMGRRLPQAIQEKGSEIRTFMPKWGIINERRGQLHEVQRLSGMNIIIDDTDHPLIIKVASIPQTKIQVYFIDNEEFFLKRKMLYDDENIPYKDNGERAIFFARGVIETMKKLRWSPDIIHCQGIMSAFVPVYIKKAYKDEPSVNNAKIVTSIFPAESSIMLEDSLKQKIAFKDITIDSLSDYNDVFTMDDIRRIAIENSDGIIAATPDVSPEIQKIAENANVKYLPYQGDDFADSFINFYDSLFEE